jgi:hypothetical protein
LLLLGATVIYRKNRVNRTTKTVLRRKKKMPIRVTPQMIQATQNQEVGKRSARTTDSRFPVYGVPVKEDHLVYIPRVDIIQGENGEQPAWLRSVLHEYSVGSSYGHIRCINGLTEDAIPGSGYDGTCPACDAERDCWTLANTKLETEARKMGVPVDDPGEAWKAVKSTVYSGRAIKGTEEFITFPIVVVPNHPENKTTPTQDALKGLRAFFVLWKRNMFNERLMSALEAIPNNPGHPAGMMWLWKYTYVPARGEQNARDAQRNAKYNIIPNTNGYYDAVIAAAEEAAKEFSALKAADVVVSNQYPTMEEITTFVDKSMIQTRTLIAALSGASIGMPITTPALSGSPEEALKAFGATPDAQAAAPSAFQQAVPQNLGVAPSPAPAPAPAETAPVMQNNTQFTPAPAPAPAAAPAPVAEGTPGAPVTFG